MPMYEFECRKCETVFEEKRPFAEAGRPATCPVCASADTKKRLSVVAFVTNGGADSIPMPLANGGGCCGGSCGCHH